MIAAVFALVLAVVIGVASLFGAGPQAAAGAIPLWAFAVVLALFLLFFAGGIYIGAALAALALIGGFTLADRPFWNFMGEILWAPSTNFVLVAVPPYLLGRLPPIEPGYRYGMVDGDLVKLVVGTSLVVDAMAGLLD